MAIAEHESFPWPKNSDARIWRYMNLAKFVHLLLKRQLFFPRASLLGDPFEGSTPKIAVESRDFIIKNRHHDPRLEHWRNISDEQLRELFSAEARIAQSSRDGCFVSCWHMNDHESAAMWDLYSRSAEAVAIQSSFARLAGGLPSYVNAGLITYIDYEREAYPQGNMFNALMHKRKSFEHEREVRAIAWETLAAELGGEEITRNMTPEGLPILVDLEKLVERIYVHPSAAPWFRAVASELVLQQRISIEVRQSVLGASPLW
jgi:hypothetical protein